MKRIIPYMIMRIPLSIPLFNIYLSTFFMHVLKKISYYHYKN